MNALIEKYNKLSEDDQKTFLKLVKQKNSNAKVAITKHGAFTSDVAKEMALFYGLTEDDFAPNERSDKVWKTTGVSKIYKEHVEQKIKNMIKIEDVITETKVSEIPFDEVSEKIQEEESEQSEPNTDEDELDV